MTKHTNLRPGDEIEYRPGGRKATAMTVTFLRFGLTGPAHLFIEDEDGERFNVPASSCFQTRSAR